MSLEARPATWLRDVSGGNAYGMSKQPKVPGMKEIKPNRAQRRHPEKVADAPIARDDADAEVTPKSVDLPPRKSTADTWNQ